MALVLVLASCLVKAQVFTPLPCAHSLTSNPNPIPLINSPLLSSTNCGKVSLDYQNKYRLQNYFKPNIGSYLPIITIPVNIVVFGEDNGTGFPFHIAPNQLDDSGNPIIASYYDINGVEIPNPYTTSSPNVQWFQRWFNFSYEHPAAPTGTGIVNPSSLPDCRIRVKILHYYFYCNSSILNDNNGNQYNLDYNAMHHHFTYNPEQTTKLNCYITKYFNIAGAAGHSPETNYNNKTIPYISSGSQYYNYSQNWAGDFFYFSQHMPHELGHRFNLNHIYNTETTSSTDIDFLDDVFGNPAVNQLNSNLMGGQSATEVSPKQMGRMHRELSTDYDNGLGHQIRHFAYGYSSAPHNITSNETWDFTFKSYNDIVVKSGATLTLKCRLEMVREAQILVEKGAKLIIDGGTVTSALNAGPEHEGLWQGIRVCGDPTKNQAQSNQGFVELKNGALIENADIAIQLNTPNSWTGGGGIAKGTNSTIRNCHKGVHIAAYANFNSTSNFTNCIFETTADLINGQNPETFIEGYVFKGLIINSCTFRNTNPNANTLAKLGTGIYLESAKASIKGISTGAVDYCNENDPNWNKCTFENLQYGVYLKNIGTPSNSNIFTSMVSGCYFTKCQYAIYNRGMYAASINRNKIKLGGNTLWFTDNQGVRQESGTGYSIQENCVENIGGNTGYPTGIVVLNTGGDNNQVYKNTTINAKTGFLSNGKNRTATPTNQKFKGLQFLCNQNQGTQEHNIAVKYYLDANNDPLVGIRQYQGGLGNLTNVRAAGNEFVGSCSTYQVYNYVTLQYDTYYSSNSDIHLSNNSVNAFTYFYEPSITNQVPTCYFLPNTIVGTTPYISPISTTNINNCPSNFSGGGGGGILNANQKQQLLANYTIHNSQYLAALIVYNSIIDNGNTQSLLQSINTTMPSNANDLKAMMLSNSPNLSDEVIKKLSGDNTILTNADLLTIIASNPDVAHNEELLKMLKEKANPMDDWMIELLRDAGEYETDRTLVEQIFAEAQYQRENDAWTMVRDLLTDTISDTLNHAELHSWLTIIGTPSAKYMIAEDLYAMGNFQGTMDILNNMVEKELDRYEVIELNGLKMWYELIRNVELSDRNLQSLKEDELNTLRSIAGDSKNRNYGIAAVMAANVINDYKADEYPPITVYPDDNATGRRSTHATATNKVRTHKKYVKNTEGSVNESSLTKIYPIPADNTLQLDISKTNNAVLLLIFDATGKQVLNLPIVGKQNVSIDTHAFNNGSYTYQLINDKQSIVSKGKLVIEHK